ncbi:MAG: M20/M25/M40 family metallo-hydrolase [Chitinophagaceae bacterium]|nr:M20/M25/M40 family metallo-hydrolase [Chitinophagaceae bacterium]
MGYKLLTAGLILFLVAGKGLEGRSQTAEDSAFLRRLADIVLTDGKAYEDLRTLTKQVGGRLSGSPGYYKAEVWGQKAFQDAHADKVWLQECMVPHWVRGGKDSASFVAGGAGSSGGGVAGKRTGLDILTLGNSVGTGAKGIMAPVLLIHSFEELEQRKDEVKGKIVFYNYVFNPKFVETFRSYGDAVRYRVFGPSQAAKYGALAVLVRSMSHSVDNNPHTGALVYNDSFPKVPAAAVGLYDADKLADAIGRGGDVRVFLRTLARMLPDTVAHNVIGELKGSLSPEQFITVGGHLDSWDPAEGAMDDGTGCVQAIEVLRALKAAGYVPKHTIRAVLFANEENGGRGGEKYMEEAKAKGERHLFALESDAGGFTPRSFSLSLSDQQLAAAQPWIRLLQPYGVYEFAKGGGGADVEPMEKLGVVAGELRPDSQRYFDYHHSRNDVLEVVNKREMELGALNMAALIYLVDKYGWGQ